MPEVQKGQEQLVFLTFILYRYNLSFYYNQVQFVPVFIIEKGNPMIPGCRLLRRKSFFFLSEDSESVPVEGK